MNCAWFIQHIVHSSGFYISFAFFTTFIVFISINCYYFLFTYVYFCMQLCSINLLAFYSVSLPVTGAAVFLLLLSFFSWFSLFPFSFFLFLLDDSLFFLSLTNTPQFLLFLSNSLFLHSLCLSFPLFLCLSYYWFLFIYKLSDDFLLNFLEIFALLIV